MPAGRPRGSTSKRHTSTDGDDDDFEMVDARRGGGRSSGEDEEDELEEQQTDEDDEDYGKAGVSALQRSSTRLSKKKDSEKPSQNLRRKSRRGSSSVEEVDAVPSSFERKRKNLAVDSDTEDDVQMGERGDCSQSKQARKKTTNGKASGRTKREGTVEESSDDNDVETSTPKKGKGKSKAEEVDDGQDDVEAVEEDEEDDEEYVIEKIMKHRTAEDGSTEYLIRWEGYSQDDDTWEPESNCNASDLIAVYWKGVPTHKQPRKMRDLQDKLKRVKSPRKKKSQSVSVDEVSSGSTDAEEVASDLQQAVPSSSSKAGGKSSVTTLATHDYEGVEVSDCESEAAHKERMRQMQMDEDLLRKWDVKSQWEDHIETVETMERSDDMVLRAKLRFKNGDSFWVERRRAYQKCPQAMLQFYETHLRFRSPTESISSNGA